MQSLKKIFKLMFFGASVCVWGGGFRFIYTYGIEECVHIVFGLCICTGFARLEKYFNIQGNIVVLRSIFLTAIKKNKVNINAFGLISCFTSMLNS